MKNRIVAVALILILVLGMTGVASARMGFFQNKGGTYYVDYRYSNNDLMLSPELENFGSRNVNWIKIAILCADEDGNFMYPSDGEDGAVRYFESSKGYAGGRTAPFGMCRMVDCRDASYVCFAIVAYRYRDNGEYVDCTDYSQSSIMDMYDWVILRWQ